MRYKVGSMRKIDSNILFLGGIIVICFGFLLFHINPYFSGPNESVEGRLILFFNSLFQRPIGTLFIILGGAMIFKGLKR